MASILFEKIKKPRKIKLGKNTKILQVFIAGKLSRIIVKSKKFNNSMEIKI